MERKMERNTTNRPVQDELEALAANGFNEEEVARLFVARWRCQQGTYSEDTEESKRLQFARWLYQHGKLQR